MGNNDNKQYIYQHKFSSIVTSLFNQEERIVKARKSIEVMKDYLTSTGRSTNELKLLDVGSSTGHMTKYYSIFFKEIVGIDIDTDAIEYAVHNNSSGNISYQYGSAMSIEFPSNSFDAVTCSHIYEHVPDARQMLKEIHRVLRKDGFCYFVAGNRLNLIEAHYKLPLLSVIPKTWAHRYIRLAGIADSYYETHLSLWGLKELVKDFKIRDYTFKIIEEPAKYSATDMITPGSFKQRISLFLINYAYWLCPTYIWILEK